MSINKTNYILKSLQKISHKQWELFVISRIIHKMDDPEIEFVTQQLVRLRNNKRALTDLYFPQFGIHLEIDERQHFENNSGLNDEFEYIADDIMRENDIVQITGREVHRIRVCDFLGNQKTDLDYRHVGNLVDNFVDVIMAEKQKKLAEGLFEPWNFEARYDPQRIIDKGKFCIADNVLLRLQVDAMRLFGFTGKGWQRGVWKVPDGSGDMVWFPRLYPHGMWHNELIEGGTVIYQRARNEEGIASIKKQRRDNEKSPKRRFIVFAKGEDALGTKLLRYVGVFKADLAGSTDEAVKFELVQDEIKIRPDLGPVSDLT